MHSSVHSLARAHILRCACSTHRSANGSGASSVRFLSGIRRELTREDLLVDYVRRRTWTVRQILETRGERGGLESGFRWVSADAPVLEAVERMVKYRVGALMVCSKDDGSHLDGIVTERDYLRKVVVQGKDSSTASVHEIMTPQEDLVVVGLDSTVIECLALMHENQFRHLPVAQRLPNDEMKLTAMLSMRELVQEFREYHEAQINYMQEYIDFPIW